MIHGNAKTDVFDLGFSSKKPETIRAENFFQLGSPRVPRGNGIGRKTQTEAKGKLMSRSLVLLLVLTGALSGCATTQTPAEAERVALDSFLIAQRTEKLEARVRSLEEFCDVLSAREVVRSATEKLGAGGDE
jgi:hypothetical protein